MPYGLTCKLVNNRGSIGARIEIAVKKRSEILDIIREFFHPALAGCWKETRTPHLSDDLSPTSPFQLLPSPRRKTTPGFPENAPAPLIRATIGTTMASVFPEALAEASITSLPENISGIALFWTSVNELNLPRNGSAHPPSAPTISLSELTKYILLHFQGVGTQRWALDKIYIHALYGASNEASYDSVRVLLITIEQVGKKFFGHFMTEAISAQTISLHVEVEQTIEQCPEIAFTEWIDGDMFHFVTETFEDISDWIIFLIIGIPTGSCSQG